MREAASGVDWDLFLRVVGRHRVEGFAEDGIRRAGVAVPEHVAKALAQAARGIVAQNLRYAAEAKRLTQRFAGAGIPHLFVKGVTLNQLAYGTLALKRSCDIDLLVDPERYGAACDLLEAAGYAVSCPQEASRAQILRHAAATKDTGWRNRQSNILVELHQRLTANRLLLPAIDTSTCRQMVEVAPNVVLPTLRREALFAYLCVHGAITSWSRLKWVADLAAFLKDDDAHGIERLYHEAQRIAPGRCAGQALLLCNRLFGTPIGPALERELRSDPGNARLAEIASKVMVQGGAERELGEQRFGTLRMHLSLLSLQPGWRYRTVEVARKLSLLGHAARRQWPRRAERV